MDFRKLCSLRVKGGGHGHPLQYSCLENPMDRGAWWATVHGVSKSQAQLMQLRTCARVKEMEIGIETGRVGETEIERRLERQSEKLIPESE